MDIWDAIIIAFFWPIVWCVIKVFPVCGSLLITVALYTA